MSTQLQNLSSQFNSLLTQYTDTYKEYISLVNSNNNSLTSIPNSAFVGKSNINILNNSTLDACQSACSSNSSCSGATFNNTLSNCTLSSGPGNIVSAQQSTAFVQQAMYYSYQLQQLNSQLTSVNQQMRNLSNSSYNQFQQSQQQIQQQEQALQNNYLILSQERDQIDGMVRQFQTLNSAYENGNLIVTSNYYSYIILLFVVIFLVFLLMQFSLFGEFSNAYLFYGFILIVIILFAILYH
jgi:septal ring factor EnvC (AmiA/AmiB activator)